jgi:hypothetical protein
LCFYALVAIVGGYAFKSLPIDAFPNISPVQVKMIMKAPGMTPEEVETRVITPIEMELLGIPGQTILRSAAKYAILSMEPTSTGLASRWRSDWLACEAIFLKASQGAWRRSQRLCPTSLCLPSMEAIFRWKSAAACSTGRSGPHCAR